MQSFKKIYSVIMKLNQFFALHFFANDLYYFSTMATVHILSIGTDRSEQTEQIQIILIRVTELQPTGGTEDNSKIVFLFLN